MEEWTLDYFSSRTLYFSRNLRRRLERRRGTCDVQTDVSFVAQDVVYDENGAPVNTIEYDQTFVVREVVTNSSTGQNETAVNQITFESMRELVTIPFQDSSITNDLTKEFRENVGGMTPNVVTDTTNDSPLTKIAIIVGACMAAIVFFICIAMCFYWC